MIGGFFKAVPWAKVHLTAQPPTVFCAEFSDLLLWDGSKGGGIRTTEASQWRYRNGALSGEAASNGPVSGSGESGSSTKLPNVIVVDFTQLSDGKIHNKFDKNAVNDVDAKRALQKQLEAQFSKYATDAALLGAGTVRIPETETSWKSMVQQLRDQVPGHFWAPVWPR